MEQGDTLLHPPLRVFFEEGGGGFPSRMLTRWVSVKDDQGRASNSRSFFVLIWTTVTFAYKAIGCRAHKEYVGLIPEDPLLVAVFAMSVLVLLSDFPAREM